MNKDNIIGFLLELNEMLESSQYKIPAELFDEGSKGIKKDLIQDWKNKVDASTADLPKKWLQEVANLETCIKQWSSAFYADFEFTEVIGKIAKIVEDWKKSLTEALYKDASIYTMPKESGDNDSNSDQNNDSLQEDSSSDSSEVMHNEEVKIIVKDDLDD